MSGSIFGVTSLVDGAAQSMAEKHPSALMPIPVNSDQSLMLSFDKLSCKLDELIDQLMTLRESIDAD